MFADGWLVWVLLSFATWRVARVLPADKIAKPLRDRIVLWAFGPDVPARSPRHKVHDLLTCTLCLSFWLSWAVVGCYRLEFVTDWTGWRYPFEVLAVWGGVAALALTVDAGGEDDA